MMLNKGERKGKELIIFMGLKKGWEREKGNFFFKFYDPTQKLEI